MKFFFQKFSEKMSRRNRFSLFTNQSRKEGMKTPVQNFFQKISEKMSRRNHFSLFTNQSGTERLKTLA
ncbi:MAG: hypothetical protein BWK80_58465 [Desulfobacteraceae bacterium IS3]|nr:MAG: hypothetical protein BWK80_58465 [Desulfobacteraceae bacterium IS3]